tara:strand:+ start:793 stop:996 length:204 start_codon:yes stop_codon:yes gene_type:complete
MAKIVWKYLKSDYKYVYGCIVYDTPKYYARIGKKSGQMRLTERQAAKDADIMLIELNRNPVNVLRPL